jgi:hypothetical protein
MDTNQSSAASVGRGEASGASSEGIDVLEVVGITTVVVEFPTADQATATSILNRALPPPLSPSTMPPPPPTAAGCGDTDCEIKFLAPD